MPPTAPPKAKPFPTPFIQADYGDGADPKTLVELRMNALSASIRSKPRWREKLGQKEIVDKWRKEAEQQGANDVQIDFVFDELRYMATKYEDLLPVEPSAVDGTWQADGLVEAELKNRFKDAVARLLENVSESNKDWHPGSNNQVLDLVHPSLFCYVYGETRETDEPAIPCLQYANKGKIKRVPKNLRGTQHKSAQYVWLPSEFHVDANGNVQINSYINNLHPIWHRELYHLIAPIFARFVPLFNRVLTDLNCPRPNRVVPDPYGWYDEEEPEFGEGSDADDEYEEWWQNRPVRVPQPSTFEPPPEPKPEDVVDLKGQDLQVIVKLANIELTPENPRYPGGVWHVEGMENEHIVASGIYYYSCENITTSKLDFRVNVHEPDYEQNDNNGVREVYGLEDGAPLNQVLGGVETQEDRCICFPNIYQHKVAPFELEDPTKPGHRKILVFFLVDPAQRITSTKTVPPQQMQWFRDMVMKDVGGPFANLPTEIIERILECSSWPMTLEKAKEHREKLMKERKFFVKENTAEVFEREFSLCEH
ncbi:hypothetical protein HK102_013454 [Quaeritorhiza haematococci]|nr:hypothetical protein HK102_013454 [Quaeritorhiza haematococci]